MNTITYHLGDVRDAMAAMPDNSVDLIVTSPPFLALRSYLPADHPDKHREIGSEPTPADFLDTLLELTQEWRRLLTPTGTIAVEIGDTYSGSGGAGGDYNDGGIRDGAPKFKGSASVERMLSRKGYGKDNARTKPKANGANNLGAAAHVDGDTPKAGPGWPLAKSLCGIPTLYTWSLAYGRNLLNPAHTFPPWRIRNLLVWTRPNPPVGALGDKFRPATSYVTVACTSDRRWFDLDSVRMPGSGQTRDYVGDKQVHLGKPLGAYTAEMAEAGAPPLDWWEHDWQPLHNMPTAPYKGAHYATYPPTLPKRLVEAMGPREVCAVCGEPRRRIVGDTSGHDNYRPGVVLDPFAGSGTTALAAALCGRDAVLIDIDPRNVALARHRIGEHVQILSTTADGPVTTWTVDHELPGLHRQHPDQMSLFE